MERRIGRPPDATASVETHVHYARERRRYLHERDVDLTIQAIQDIGTLAFTVCKAQNRIRLELLTKESSRGTIGKISRIL